MDQKFSSKIRITPSEVRTKGDYSYGHIDTLCSECVVGCVGFRYDHKENKAVLGHFSDIFNVNPEFNGRGIATSMGSKAIEIIKKNFPDCKYIKLDTTSSNSGMRKVAERLGFLEDFEIDGNVIYKLEI
jgi:RimJ/RimL family protein N-acetyltransferase